jgi:hypothetical protein
MSSLRYEELELELVVEVEVEVVGVGVGGGTHCIDSDHCVES